MKYFIYFIVIIAFLDTFSQLPIMSTYAQSLGGTPLIIGLVIGMYSFANMIGNIIAGISVDKFGAKKVLYTSMGITSFIVLLYTIVQNGEQLLVVRFLHGFSDGFLIPAAFTFLSKQTKSTKQGKAMALSGAAVGTAAIVGPAFSGIMKATAGIQWVFITISILMMIGTIVSLFLLPSHITRTDTSRTQMMTKEDMMALVKSEPLLQAYIGAFTLMFSQGIVTYMLPMKVEALALKSSTTGMMMSIFGITAILFFLLPTNRIFDRFNRSKMMLIGITVMALSLSLLGLFTTKGMIFIVMMIYGVGFAILFPSINALLVENTTENNRGKAFGLFYAFFSLGVVAGSFTIGAIGASPSVSFIIGTAFLLTFAGMIYVRGKVKKTMLG
ncbi:MFS transporter [Bacillus cytotoxicus]|uniref:Major facilitator superfamily MFS_1 n=1 Tax=Bacillus cytotoxicus TaxID=580165 RepID=A0AAX2CCR1_9BACI|nr:MULTISPECIES: MFS transporter [Bacillus cereus group]AWC31562.1 MFS transporter [Bacillus cytotoxicus]AWC35602.1 MFS transporter [Bacillus cytotoxicus]AWC59834.1 MFS transporter [Bacillus cytotoxicus]KMT49967.1 bicyclomycin resistance protein [Bacillus cytotoxicus]MDH2880023.1 MFS transporter [Bacillus cytotoxicus]